MAKNFCSVHKNFVGFKDGFMTDAMKKKASSLFDQIRSGDIVNGLGSLSMNKKYFLFKDMIKKVETIEHQEIKKVFTDNICELMDTTEYSLDHMVNIESMGRLFRELAASSLVETSSMIDMFGENDNQLIENTVLLLLNEFNFNKTVLPCEEVEM